MHEKKTSIVLSEDLNLISLVLSEVYAEKIETLLKRSYVIFPRSRCVLTKDHIFTGFEKNGWLGTGLVTKTGKLIACAISRPLGQFKFQDGSSINTCGLVDFLCIDTTYRKKGLASYLLEQLVALTASKGRLVHIFQKEGFPLSPLPPIWTSRYVWRKKNKFASILGGTLKPTLFQTLPEIRNTTQFLTNHPGTQEVDCGFWIYESPDTVQKVVLCITNTFHRSVPEGHKIGEILWQMDLTEGVTDSFREKATEVLIDSSQFDIVLMDATIPYNKGRDWHNDAPYSWYIFNCDPKSYFSMKPLIVV